MGTVEEGTARMRAAVEAELRGNLLPFWRERSVDHARGGFIGEMADEGVVRVDAAKGLILHSRILWSFAAVYRALADERDLRLARRAYEYLLEHFADGARGGFHWRVDPAGRAIDCTRKIYGHAFCIYALSEYFLATREAAALEEAQRTFGLVERHAHDEDHGGYVEALAADWSPVADQRLSHKDMNAARSMNNHLHVLEAYTNLYRVWPSRDVAQRLGELIDLFGTRIVCREGGATHLVHFFDESWARLSETYSYGHDIEAAWLLCEAADALNDATRRTVARRQAIDLAGTVLAEGLDADGGLSYEGRGGQVTDPSREWWCQAEAVVGFRQAYELTGEARFAAASERVWDFIGSKVVDRANGEWSWRVRPDGTVDRSEPRVSEWKGPYHNMRMCLEMMRRIDHEGQGHGT